MTTTSIIIFKHQQPIPNSLEVGFAHYVVLEGHLDSSDLTLITLEEIGDTFALRANGQLRSFKKTEANPGYLHTLVQALTGDLCFQLTTYTFIAMFLVRACERSVHRTIIVIDGVECLLPTTGRKKIPPFKLPYSCEQINSFVLDLFVAIDAAGEVAQNDRDFAALEKKMQKAEADASRAYSFLAKYVPSPAANATNSGGVGVAQTFADRAARRAKRRGIAFSASTNARSTRNQSDSIPSASVSAGGCRPCRQRRANQSSSIPGARMTIRGFWLCDIPHFCVRSPR